MFEMGFGNLTALTKAGTLNKGLLKAHLTIVHLACQKNEDVLSGRLRQLQQENVEGALISNRC